VKTYDIIKPQHSPTNTLYVGPNQDGDLFVRNWQNLQILKNAD